MLQPTLQGTTVLLCPLAEDDFDSLHAVASAPLIWAKHPSPNRYQKPVFEKWFLQAIHSKGALVVTDLDTGQTIGSSRYYDWDKVNEEVAIGFTFLSRAYWGATTNGEMKKLMIDHALQSVKIVWFHVDPTNIRSKMALEKIGARFSHCAPKEISGKFNDYLFYTVSHNGDNIN
ncbi:GNAT family N-acetyltransferase [Ampullimonas aquatilis]|uniref:GNAT family N-acetyltransferase n=1 Tax=Ampullimonas aquatilis TaxID=1341549 RepID=UPI003C73706C